MPGETPEKLSVPTAHEKRQSKRTLDWWIEVIAKLGTPIIVGILTVIVSYEAGSIQNRISTATLLSEREKAESELRASMFKSLIDPFVGSQKGGGRPPDQIDREQLLVELLALNFHEHFEMKPLFRHVDAGLALIKDKGAQEKRDALRSITRRIIDRQIAMLQMEDIEGESDRYARAYTLMIVESPQTEKQQELFAKLKEGSKSKVYQEGEWTDGLTTPDQRHRFTISFDNADWEKEKLTVLVQDSPCGPNGSCVTKAGSSHYPITLEWFDLPLTDNTLFPDGNRFSIVLYDVRKEGPLKNITLKFIVFPKNYYTPRERPFDHGRYLELVGKNGAHNDK